MTLSLAGSQVIWSLELAYGTPYLLAIGLSKEATGLVWIAGPLSGLVMQPVLGSLSDSSTSRWRRRKYMLGSALAVALGTSAIAFSEPIAETLLDVLDVGLGDWDPVRKGRVLLLVQIVSILGFWVLDFAVNGLQVISRALLLDSAGSSEQNEAGAWHGRMLHIGNIIGYGCGYVNLADWPSLHWLGGGQFRKFAMLALAGMGIGVGVTCATTPETAYRHATPPGVSGWRRVVQSLRQVVHVAWRLPLSIQRVCTTQLLVRIHKLTQATMSWFPFLFYSTTFILDVARKSSLHKRRLDHEEEVGSFGMLLFALLSMAAGTLLPLCTMAGHTPEDTPDPHARAALRFRPMSLRSMWTLGTLVHAALLFGTLVVRTQTQAIVLVMLMGVPWSIWTWVPFALLGEFVREAESEPAQDAAEDQWSAHQVMDRPERGQRTSVHDPDSARRFSSTLDSPRASGVPHRASGSYVSSVVSRGREVPSDIAPLDDSIRGGTVLGIHNLVVVVPQFVVALVATLLFRLTRRAPTRKHPGSDGDVTWVLGFGAFMALGAALLTRRIPLTQSERRAFDRGYVRVPLDEEEEADAVAPPDS